MKYRIQVQLREKHTLHENKNIQEYSCLEYVIVTP